MSYDAAQIQELSDIDDYSTVYTPNTSAESAGSLTKVDEDHAPSKPSVPWPGSTYVIKSISSEDLLTLVGGQVVLAPPTEHASTCWKCVQNGGWLGLQEPVSGRFLGRNDHWDLVCQAETHQGYENLTLRSTPDGGHMLLMPHLFDIFPVGVKDRGAETKLAVVLQGKPNTFICQFFKCS